MTIEKELHLPPYKLTVSVQSKEAYAHSMMVDNKEEIERLVYSIQRELCPIIENDREQKNVGESK